MNFALNRRALTRAATTTPLADRLTDQYIPPSLPGFKDTDIYPLERPNLARARALTRGNLRGRKAVLYAINDPQSLAIAQATRQQLAAIGLDVELQPLPPPALFSSVYEPGEPWDLLLVNWASDFVDPFQFINVLFDPQFALSGNIGRFDSRFYTSRMREAARRQGVERYRAYAELDVRLARDAAPSAPINFFNEATLVSTRVGCVVLRPALDLTAVCVK